MSGENNRAISAAADRAARATANFLKRFRFFALIAAVAICYFSYKALTYNPAKTNLKSKFITPPTPAFDIASSLTSAPVIPTPTPIPPFNFTPTPTPTPSVRIVYIVVTATPTFTPTPSPTPVVIYVKQKCPEPTPCPSCLTPRVGQVCIFGEGLKEIYLNGQGLALPFCFDVAPGAWDYTLHIVR